MIYNHRGRKISLTPYDLFSRYNDFLPLLLPHALTLSFCLITLFSHDLPLDLKEAVRLGGYILPDLSRLSTSLLQEQAF